MALLLGSTVCLSVVTECEHRPLARRMSAPGLTSEAQLRYILQWFGEFSELQREDFLPVLAAARGDKPDQLAASLATIACHDKPVSLFQCRIKLFNEWFPTWAEEEQDRVIKGVSEIDAEFGTKLQNLMTNGPQMNGDQNGTSELHSPSAPEEENKTEESENWTNGENGDVVAEDNTEQAVPDNIPIEIAAAS